MNHCSGVYINRPLKGKAVVFTGFEDAGAGLPDGDIQKYGNRKMREKEKLLYCCIEHNIDTI